MKNKKGVLNNKKDTGGRIIVLHEKCKGCGFCIRACPKGLIDVAKDFNKQGFHPAYLRSEDGCTGCSLCAVSCPDVAIEVYKKLKVESSKLR